LTFTLPNKTVHGDRLAETPAIEILRGNLKIDGSPDSKSFRVVETVDSEKLARRLNETGKPLEVMVEVKLSEEGSKAGAAPEELTGLIAAIRGCANLDLTGLMTMPPWNPDPETTRPYFRKLAELARIHRLPKLSMGMSHDLEAAIEEGATHIRVGTALFGPRPRASE